MKRILLTIIAVIEVLFSFGQNGPIIHFNTTTYNFGKLSEEESAYCVFKITNIGNEPLMIQAVRCSSGALQFSWSQDAIPPKGTSELDVTIKHWRSKSFYSIVVESNDNNNSIVYLRVRNDGKNKEDLLNAVTGASLTDAITFLKECPYDNDKKSIENIILTSKIHSFSDVDYVLNNYPDLIEKMEDVAWRLVGSLSDFNTYTKYYPKTNAELDDKLYQYVKSSNEIGDCDTYLKNYPNGKHKSEVTAQKNEIASYKAARNGGKTECIAYLTKYPNGRFTSEIQTKKEGFVKEEKRQAQIKVNSNKGIWKLGNKLCNCTSDGIIMATLDQWNEDHSSFKGIITASPGGLFQGDILQKGNQLWFETKGWHKCLDDEIDFALNHDRSLEAEQLLKAKKMKFAKGIVVAHTYYTRGWLFSSSYRVTAKVDDWNDDYTRMKIQIIKTDGLDYIDGESIYEGKYIWVSPIGWE